jgi:ABC-type nickel/cobalt efflux system permease component RcnA
MLALNSFLIKHLKTIIMKKISFLTLILFGTIVLFSACNKEAGTPQAHEVPAPTEKANTVTIENNEVAVKLTVLSGFSDPCFNISLDDVFQETFRFTGGYEYLVWNYSNLTPGLHSVSFTCSHECRHAHDSEIMKFEIVDGNNHKKVSARETEHCKYEFWLNVN